MSSGLDEIKYKLSADEPDYEELKKLGRSILPYLEILSKNTEDPLLATKAIHLSSLIDVNSDKVLSEGKVNILLDASKSSLPEVRVSAASAVANVIPDLNSQGDSQGINRIANLLLSLQADEDIGVKKLVNRIVDTYGDMLGSANKVILINNAKRIDEISLQSKKKN